MPRYQVQYTQLFDVTSVVEAATPDEAWRKVLDGDEHVVDQSPQEILDDDDDEHFIVEDPTAGWEASQ